MGYIRTTLTQKCTYVRIYVYALRISKVYVYSMCCGTQSVILCALLRMHALQCSAPPREILPYEKLNFTENIQYRVSLTLGACAARVTVVVVCVCLSVCLSVCLLFDNSLHEWLFASKTNTHIQRRMEVKKYVGFSLKLLRSRVMA